LIYRMINKHGLSFDVKDIEFVKKDMREDYYEIEENGEKVRVYEDEKE